VFGRAANPLPSITGESMMTVLAEPAQLTTVAQSNPELSTLQPHQALPPTATEQAPESERAPSITFACYFAALATMTVSLNTSWRFFDKVLHISTDYGERYIMFAVAELALIVSGAGMAANVRRTGQPGSFRMVVWGMCGVSAYMAWKMSNLEEGIGRILLGPALGTIMLHLALGLELRSRHHRSGTLARIGHELRERTLSRLGLADDERDALQRSRDRSAYRAAQLCLPRRWRWSRQARLQRALMAAHIADDEHLRGRMLARLSVLRHAHELATYDQPSPWPSSSSSPIDEEEDEDEDEEKDILPRQRLESVATEIKERGQTKRSIDEIVQVLEHTYNHGEPRPPGKREIGRRTGLTHEVVARIQVAAENRLEDRDAQKPCC
jgi:hypothetical protein